MRQTYIRPAEAASRINWPELLDLAERMGVRVWRYDKKIGRVVVVESVVGEGHPAMTAAHRGHTSSGDKGVGAGQESRAHERVNSPMSRPSISRAEITDLMRGTP